MRKLISKLPHKFKSKLGLIMVVVIFCGLALQSCLHNPNSQVWNVEYKTDACLIPMKDGQFYICDNQDFQINEISVTLPMLFKTDLASIPRLFWAFYSPFDYQYISPAILHDYLYACPNGLNRKDIDDIFYYSLITSGSEKFTAYLFWVTVRIFGNAHFIQDKDCYGSYIADIEEPEESPAHYFISKHTEPEDSNKVTQS